METTGVQLPLDEQRVRDLHRLVSDVADRRRRGESVNDGEVIAANPGLMPELAVELRIIEEIRRAQVTARTIGPMHEPLVPLTDSQLEAPIESSLDDSDEPLPHPVLGGYQIQEEIGSGSQGTVFKAVQESTGRQVAIKVFAGGALASARARNRLNREAEIMASLDHANIVGILDRGRTVDGTFYLVMPFVAGLPLDEYAMQLVEKGPAPIEKILKVFVRAATALHTAHARNVVHRDLKPQNMIVDEWGEPHVLDFGLAKFMDSLPNERQSLMTMAGQVVGSLAWTSPEQAGSGGTVDARSDVYSLGVMLYQALTGKFPYDVLLPLTQVLRRIQSEIPKPPSALAMAGLGPIAPGLDAVVLKALAKSPGERYASAAELAGDLENLLSGRPTLAISHRRRAPKIDQRIWIALAGLLMIGTALGLGFRRVSDGKVVIPQQVFKLPGYTNSVGMKLVRISPGSYMMGSPLNEEGCASNEFRRKVFIEKSFWIGTTDVTRKQYRMVMGSDRVGSTDASDDLPMTDVSWSDAVEFCRKLGEIEKKSYRLPTEAEWEFACRAGSDGPLPAGAKIEDMAWYAANSGGHLHAVGSKVPNAWGLYDMQGNAGQWCSDSYLENEHATTIPINQEHNVRGGSFNSAATYCRAAIRGHMNDVPLGWITFRIVMDITP